MVTRITTRTEDEASNTYHSLRSLFIPEQSLSYLSCLEQIDTWLFILTLTSLLLHVCSKLVQRDKILSLGRKKFNMDPAKVRFAHSACEEKAGRKNFCWLPVCLQPSMLKKLQHETVGLVSYLTKAPVSSTLCTTPKMVF